MMIHNKYLVSMHVIIYICCFFLEYINIAYIENYMYIKYILIVLIGIYCLRYIPIIFKIKKYRLINYLLVLLTFWVVITSYFNNGNSGRNSFLAAIVYYASLLELVMVFEIAFYKHKQKTLLKTLCQLFICFSLICDLQVLIMAFANTIDSGKTIFLVGNKFNVCSLNLNSIILWWICKLYDNKRMKFSSIVLVSLVLFFVSILSMCTTYVIAAIIIILCAIKKDKLFKVISNPIIFWIVFVLSFTFIFWYPKLFDIGIVNKIFDYFGENLQELSGRIFVYKKLPLLFIGSPVVGYGYGSAFSILMSLISTADAQNGFWQLFMDMGTVGAILYAIILSLPYYKNKEGVPYPIYVYIFINLILSFIEVPYTNQLLSIVLLGFLMSDMKYKKIA